MGYKKTVWNDHVVDGEGVVVQQGTPVNAENLNNMEKGIENSVSKDGGDTIAGGVKLKSITGETGGAVLAEGNGTSLSAFDDLSDEEGDRQVLKVNTADASDNDTAVQLQRTKDGKNETFNVIHTGNKNLIKPEDIGAAPSSHGTHVAFPQPVLKWMEQQPRVAEQPLLVLTTDTQQIHREHLRPMLRVIQHTEKEATPSTVTLSCLMPPTVQAEQAAVSLQLLRRPRRLMTWHHPQKRRQKTHRLQQTERLMLHTEITFRQPKLRTEQGS